jgi:hypothetical protein
MTSKLGRRRTLSLPLHGGRLVVSVELRYGSDIWKKLMRVTATVLIARAAVPKESRSEASSSS